MVKLKGKIRVQGNSFCIPVRKALVDSDVLQLGKEYVFVLEEDLGKKFNPIECLNECNSAWSNDLIINSEIVGCEV